MATPLTLLEKLRSDPQPEHWDRFFKLYRPYVMSILGKYDLQAADRENLFQEVMAAWCEHLKVFKHNGRPGALRRWFTITTRNRFLDLVRKESRWRRQTALGDLLADLVDVKSELNAYIEQKHCTAIAEAALKLVEERFNPDHCRVFRLVYLDGRPTDEIARDLGIKVANIHLIICRIRDMLRKEFGEMIEFE